MWWSDEEFSYKWLRYPVGELGRRGGENSDNSQCMTLYSVQHDHWHAKQWVGDTRGIIQSIV